MRIALAPEIAAAAALINDLESKLRGYQREMLAHPIAGPSLRNYVILTEYPEILHKLCLSVADRFWSRYYWFARFTLKWNGIAGYDAGLEQQRYLLLENTDANWELLAEVEALARRDAIICPRIL